MRWLAVVLVVLLAACGGGDGGASSEAGPDLGGLELPADAVLVLDQGGGESQWDTDASVDEVISFFADQGLPGWSSEEAAGMFTGTWDGGEVSAVETGGGVTRIVVKV